MQATTTDEAVRTNATPGRSLKDWPGWYYVPGIAFVVIGILALAEPPLASLAASFYVGVMLGVAGAIMIVGGIANIRHHGGWIALVLGLLSLVTGLFMLGNPIAGAVSLVRLLAAWLLVGGIFELAIGFRLPVGRGWLIFVSLVNIALGLLVFTMPPAAAFRLLGYFVGASMIFQGLWALMFTAGLDRGRRLGPTN